MQALENFCTDLQGSITGALIFAIPNGHLYCTALLKATCCFQPPANLPPSSSSTTSSPQQAATNNNSNSGSGTRATRTHGEPSTGHHVGSSSAQQPTASATNISCGSSDGAISPPTRLLDTNGANSTHQSPSRHVASSSKSGLAAPWKGTTAMTSAVTGGGGGGVGVISTAFRPPQSQGIPITSSRRSFHRRSSWRTNSYGGGGSAYASPFSPFSGPGSFLQSAAVVGSRHSSLNSWSVWNPESFDSRFGRDLLWGDVSSSVPHSLRSWVFVGEPRDSDLSGIVCTFVVSRVCYRAFSNRTKLLIYM